jgi:hypothetical protein
MKTQFLELNNQRFQFYLDRKSYPCIIANGKPIRLHRYVWQVSNGLIPEEIQLHHKDRNKMNWALDNLQPVTREEHQAIHRRWRSGSG